MDITNRMAIIRRQNALPPMMSTAKHTVFNAFRKKEYRVLDLIPH